MSETRRRTFPLAEGVKGDAVMSKDGRYRYMLTRDWFPKRSGSVMFVMLNPSTADADLDDPTLRRCQSFARSWGYDGVTVMNLFAWRAADPHELEVRGRDTVGPENGYLLKTITEARGTGMVVAAWGAHRIAVGRGRWYRDLAASLDVTLHVLGWTQKGYPLHPLYQKGDLEPVVWNP